MPASTAKEAATLVEAGIVSLSRETTRVAEAITTARSTQAEAFFAELPATDRAILARILGRLRG